MSVNQLTGTSSYGETTNMPTAQGALNPGSAVADAQNKLVTVPEFKTAQESRKAIAKAEAPLIKTDSTQTSSTKKQIPLQDKEDSLKSQQEGHEYKDLTDSEKRMINELRIRDREVRAHEQAHKSVAGNLARGGVSYSYQTGPDGKKYAIGGEVSIDTSAVPQNPEATARKAEKIIRASYAAAEPSSQDRRVAAQAAQMLVQARQDLRNQEIQEQGIDQELRSERAKEAREKVEDDAEVVEPDEQVDFFENVSLIENGGADVLNLVQVGNDQNKGDLPEFFADSVLAFEGSKIMIDQFLATQEMISTDGFMGVGGRMDLYA